MESFDYDYDPLDVNFVMVLLEGEVIDELEADELIEILDYVSGWEDDPNF